MPHTATMLTSWARAIRDALAAAGVDAVPLFRAAGLDPAALSDREARYPVAATDKLWALAVQATGDPAFGLAVARHTDHKTFHALGYSIDASATLGEAFERLRRYLALVTEGFTLRTTREAGRFTCRIELPAGIAARPHEAVDAFALVIVRVCRTLLGRDHAPLALRLARPAPADPAPFERAFRTRIRFGAAENALDLDAATLDLPIEGAHPELARASEALAARYLERREEGDIVTRVREALALQLPAGEPSQSRIAAALNLSPRSLQRHLAAAGARYSTLLDETRHALALQHLADDRHSLGEIAFLLGFADASSFSHAFRRWTGVPPSQYRPDAEAS